MLCGGALIMADTGMSREMGGRLGNFAALRCDTQGDDAGNGHMLHILHKGTKEPVPLLPIPGTTA